jgi:thymidylate synthase
MHLRFKGINEAFTGIVSGIQSGRIPVTVEASRNGEVLQVNEPLTVTYEKPKERVLFLEARDANPFLHVFESLWMLAGRQDVESLSYYSSQMREYSNDGLTLSGAYGHRWRHFYSSSGDMYDEIDQLEIIINHLRKNPDSRRAVLQMWNPYDDLLNLETSKDICCNVSAFFSISNGKLDITVCNRSNDVIWGMLGANAVHFSFLQEYVAIALGLEVGVYNQFTSNAHIYTETNSGWKPEVWLEHETNRDQFSPKRWGYENDVVTTVPLVEDVEVFDLEVQCFVELNKKTPPSLIEYPNWKEPFLRTVAQPMCQAFHCHKQRDYATAQRLASKIVADDWRIVSTNWIKKRQEKWEAKQSKEIK